VLELVACLFNFQSIISRNFGRPSFAARAWRRCCIPRRFRRSSNTRRKFSSDITAITTGETVREVFGSTSWKIGDTGGGLRRWQIDLYWGEDEPLGPGKLLARPRGTEFEYAYSEARLKAATRKD
jgi:hypothetical protein